METEAFTCGVTYRRLKPYLLMILVQIASAFLYFITDAAFHHGMNPHVYVTYRHIVGGVVVLPFAYYFERKIRPKMTLILFIQIFLYSLLGVGLTINMYFASLEYTSPAFLSATINTIPTLTFLLAVVFRLEALNIKQPHGLAKAAGTFVSLAGALIITIYRGPVIRSLWQSPMHLTGGDYKSDWVKGPILSIASCITWSTWFTMQGFILKRYPAQLSLTAWANLMGAAQSAVFSALVVRHQPRAWITKSLVDVATILFGGVVSSSLNFVMIIYCSKQKGPVFVTMFCPLQTLLVVIFGYFILGENLYMGSIIGGATIIIGLYLLLWGKGSEQEDVITPQNQSSSGSSQHKESMMQIVTVLEDKDLKH